MPPAGTSRFRFGVFQVDLRAGELLRNGARIRLQEKPFRILELLIREAGEVVTREELRQTLWPSDTFVDFDHSIGTAINKLRQALGDSAQKTRYVETLPGRGYRFVAPVTAVVAGAAGTGGEATGGTAAPDAVRAREPRLSGTHLWLAAVAAVLLGILGGTLALQTPREPRVLRAVQLTNFGRVESEGGGALVTDGARLYFAERDGGHVTPAQVPVGGGEPQPIPSPFTNTTLMDISPDRSELRVASFVGVGDARPLWSMPVLGGPPRREGNTTVSTLAVWSPDGSELVYDRDSDLYLAHSDGSRARKLASTAGTPIQPRWSADGRLLRFTVQDSLGKYSLWEVAADGSNLRRLFAQGKEAPEPEHAAAEDVSDGIWVAGGAYFVFGSRSREPSGSFVSRLWAVREKGFLAGRRKPAPVLLYASPMELEAPVASADGKRIFLIGRQERRELARFDAEGNQFVPYLAGIPALWPSFSRDGRWVTYVTFPDRLLWRSRPDGGDRLQLTFAPMQAYYPRWSPDGTRIAFMGQVPGEPGKLYVLVPSVGGELEPILSGQYAQDNPNWSPDGKSLLFRGCALERDQTTCPPRLSVLDLQTKRLTDLPGSDGLGDPNWSPDGRYVVAHSEDSKLLRIFDFTTRQWSNLAHGALFGRACWSADSRTVYFQDFYGGVAQPILRVRATGGPVEKLTGTKQLLPVGVTAFSLTGLAPDGSPLATLIRTNSDIYALDVDFP